MATTQISAEIEAPPEVVFSVISEPRRLSEWDTTYEGATPLESDLDGGPAFRVDRTLANRGMHFACRVVRAEPPSEFSFVCDGSAGETLREHFSLSATDSGTRFTREMDFELGAPDPLGEIPGLTFTQAWMDRSVEQAFAHLQAMLGTAARDRAPQPSPGDSETRTEESGGLGDRYEGIPEQPQERSVSGS